jgi:hypothetical protein
MSINDPLLDVIDQRIKTSAERTSAVGTVAYRSTSFHDRECLVTFDGSSVAVPCKMAGDVEVQSGDRVGLQKFGSDWAVIVSFTRRWPNEIGFDTTAATGTSTSTTYTDVPGSPAFTIIKRYDETTLKLYVSVSCSSDSTGMRAMFGLSDGTTTYDVVSVHLGATAFVRYSMSSYRSLFAFPAGEYTFTLQWKRTAGTGTLQMFVDDDWVSIGATEIAPL